MSEVAETTHTFGQRLEAALRDGLHDAGIAATVETEPVPTTLLHRALVVSPQSEDLKYMDHQGVVRRIASHRFSPDEQLHISAIHTMTPDELDGR